MAALSFRPLDRPNDLIPRLQRCLPDFWEVHELDGCVLVERDRLDREQVRRMVEGALRRIYGRRWREHVSGCG